MSIGWLQILLIVAVVLLLFGSKRIPELARSLGRAAHEFKKAKEEFKRESEEMIDVAEKSAAKEDEKRLAEKSEDKPSDPA